MTGAAEILVALLLSVTLLALIARRVNIPYPIVFVLGGLVLGWVPKMPRIRLDPELVFLFLLPPLLFPAALFMPWRDFRANLRPIGLLAVGLVLITTAAVAYLAQYFMNLPLAAGFALGAIISPPDAIAATAIAHRLKVPHRIVTILEGESLLNDATALVTYQFAVAAVVTGAFSLAHATERFFLVAAGGIVVGLATGWLAKEFHQRVDDAPIEITVSLLTPFVAYLLAERFALSGVLAVVTTGLYLGMRTPELLSFRTRLKAGPVWETLEFLLNGFVFIIIGLQFPEVLRALVRDQFPHRELIRYALLISLAVIVVRVVWVFAATYLPRFLPIEMLRRDPSPPWRHVAIVAWTGMRGVVSLAAALALPLAQNNGLAFPGRDLIIYLTFVVIVATLVLQGLSLPLLLRWLRIPEDQSVEREERAARLKANQAALQRLQKIAEGDSAKADARDRLRIEYEDHIRELQAVETQNARSPLRLFSAEYERLSREALAVERKTLLQLRDEEVISDEVLRRIQRDIDLAEARLKQHQ